MPKLVDFDQPIVFALAIVLIAVGGAAFLSWLFASLGWGGPLGLVKGGVMAE